MRCGALGCSAFRGSDRFSVTKSFQKRERHLPFAARVAGNIGPRSNSPDTGMVLNQDLNSGRAGGAQYHPQPAAARDTACSPASGQLRRQGPGPQAIIVSSRLLDLTLLVDVQLEIASVRRR